MAAGDAPKGNVPVRYCAVYDCTNNYKTHPELSYFAIPQEEDRCRTWLKRIRREDLMPTAAEIRASKGSHMRLVSGYYRVCEAHFEPRFLNTNRNRRRLSRRAAPTLRLPRAAANAAPPPAAARAPSAILRNLTQSELEVFEYVDKKVKPRSDKPNPDFGHLAPPVPASAELADFFSGCDKHLDPSMSQFVKLVAQLKQKANGEGLKDLCVKLLFSSPPAYRLLRGALALPPESAVRRYCAPLLFDFDCKLSALLKLRVDRMTEDEKDCTISIDFIDLKPHLYYDITNDRIVGLHEVDGTQSPWPATQCAVVSARALRAGWVQAAALCALATPAPLDAWLDGVVRRLGALGLRVRALVSDPAASLRGVTPECPYFYVDEHKIYRIYDAPRLMKQLILNFMMYDFQFENKTAKWKDVLEYRGSERYKALTLTPKFTDEHIDTGRVRGMRPRAAARALGPPLPAALVALAGRAPGGTARDTAMFILKINNLYDILSSTTMRATSEFKRRLTQDPEQIGFLAYMSLFFKNLQLKKNTSGTCATEMWRLGERWRVTIEAVLALRREAGAGGGLATARLHLDDRVSAALGRPSLRRAGAAFKRRFLDDLAQPPGKREDVDVSSVLSRVSAVEGEPIIVKEEPFSVEEEMAVRASE